MSVLVLHTRVASKGHMQSLCQSFQPRSRHLIVGGNIAGKRKKRWAETNELSLGGHIDHVLEIPHCPAHGFVGFEGHGDLESLSL